MPRRSARLAKKRESKLKRKRPITTEVNSSDEYEPSPSSESEAEKMGVTNLSDLDVYKLPSSAENECDEFEEIHSDSVSCSSEPPSKRRRLNSPMSSSPETPVESTTSTPKRSWRSGSKWSVKTGTGFSTKEKALLAIDYIKGRDVGYQIRYIKGFKCGAYWMLRKAKTKQKKKDIKEAIEVFEEWLKDYESKKDHIEHFDNLSLETIEKFEKLVDLYNLEERKEEEMEHDECDLFEVETTYLRVLRGLNGEIGALRTTPISIAVDHGQGSDESDGESDDADGDSASNDKMSWDIARNLKLMELKEKLIDQDIRCNGMMRTVDEALLYYKRGKLKGYPSRIHLQMIMYGYTPHKNAIRRLAKDVARRVKEVKKGYFIK